MSKLYDVKGPCKYKGQLLLEDDGWFEGVIAHPYSSNYRGNKLIFGAFFPDKTINYFEFGVPDSPILAFTCNKCDEGYVGAMNTIMVNSSRIQLSGAAQMTLEEVTSAERNVEAESESLKARIEKYKSRMHQDFVIWYSNYSLSEVREAFCQDTLKAYERSHQVLTIGTMHGENKD